MINIPRVIPVHPDVEISEVIKKSSLVIATAEFGKKPGRFMPPTPEEIIATSSLSLSQLSSPVEILTIRLENQGDNVQLIVEWGQKRLTTQFQIT